MKIGHIVKGTDIKLLFMLYHQYFLFPFVRNQAERSISYFKKKAYSLNKDGVFFVLTYTILSIHVHVCVVCPHLQAEIFS